MLDGAQAESYVRYRDTSVSGSNTERMERQMQFISAMFEQLKAQASSDLGGYGSFWTVPEVHGDQHDNG